MIAPKREGEACARFLGPLLERAKQGDSSAMDELFAQLRPQIRALLALPTKGRREASADVEDATQVACLATLFQLARLPSTDLLHHMVRIGRHELARIRTVRRGPRKARFVSALSLDIIDRLTPTVMKAKFDPARIAQEREQMVRAITALENFTLRDKLILWAVLVEGQSHEECGRLFGVSKTTVQRIVSKGRASIARRLRTDG